MIYDYAKQRNISHKRTGKLIVATNSTQMEKDLPRLLQQGIQNGLHNLKLLTGDEVTQNYESDITCEGAIYSPYTGIINSHQFMLSLLADAELHGAILATNSRVTDVTIQHHTNHDNDHSNSTFTSNSNTTNNYPIHNHYAAQPQPHIPSHSSSSMPQFVITTQDDTKLSCNELINCTGLHASIIASKLVQSAHTHIKSHNHTPYQTPPQYFAKGNYFKLERQKHAFSHLIYPIPESGGLGVHATLDLHGNLRFGPDVEWIQMKHTAKNYDPDAIDLSVNSQRAQTFYSQIRKYWPNLQNDTLAPDYAGIRPKLTHPHLTTTTTTTTTTTSAFPSFTDNNNNNNNNCDKNDNSNFHKNHSSKPLNYSDFIIHSSAQHGIPHFVNLQGIESPGLTSSMAIADHVVQLLTADRQSI